MSDEVLWGNVDRYLEEAVIPPDESLESLRATNLAAGLPAIDVSALQGRFLSLLCRAVGAARVLEIGTLGGYSTAWLARAVAPRGRVLTLEVDPHHAEVARANLQAAGVASVVDVRVGPALESLARMKSGDTPPFDFVFVDADKPSNPAYLDEALRLSRPGTVIVFDNVVREGEVLNADASDANVEGVRRLFEKIRDDPRLAATAIQTVGSKGYDGFALVFVKET